MRVESDNLPDWAWKRAEELAGYTKLFRSEPANRAFARYIAAHETAPVDPLAEAVEAVWHLAIGPKGEAVAKMTAELRARGVTLKEGDA